MRRTGERGLQRRQVRMLLYLADPSARVMEINHKLFMQRQGGAQISVLRADVEHLSSLGLLSKPDENGWMVLTEQGKRTLEMLDPAKPPRGGVDMEF